MLGSFKMHPSPLSYDGKLSELSLKSRHALACVGQMLNIRFLVLQTRTRNNDGGSDGAPHFLDMAMASFAVVLVWSLLQRQQQRGLGFASHLTRRLPSCLSRFQSSTDDIMSGQSLSKEELRAKRLERLGIAPKTMSFSEDLPAAATNNRKRAEDIVKENTKPKAVAENRPPSSQIISLLSDDESEEASHELQRAKKQAKTEQDREWTGPGVKTAASSKKPDPSQKASTKTSASWGESGPSSDSSTFSVATWNVWFGPDGEGSPHPSRRMKAICDELLSPSHKPLWFVGFQEVVDKLYTQLALSLQSANYTMFRQQTDGFGYGCAMAVYNKNNELSILDHGFKPYSGTRQDRGLLWVRVRAHTQKLTILFATTHLESYCGPSYTGAEQRAKQIQQIDAFCETKSCDVAILNGDMNWDDELSPRSKRQLMDVPLLSLLPADTGSSWTDTWLVANANSRTTEPGYTYDPKKNPMFNGGNLQRRFDRCLIRGTEATVLGRPQIVGQAALPALTFEKVNPYTGLAKTMPVAPSDHFGYVCKLHILPK
jgi:hypothetical protein